MRLTDLAIQKLPLTETGQKRYFDDQLPGFGITVGTRAKTFIVMYGKERKLEALGRYPDISLREARTRAMGVLASKTGETPTHPPTPFPEAILLFLEGARGRLKPATLDQYRAYLETFGFQKNVADITRSDITDKLSLWEGKPWAQNYAYASLRAFLNWCLVTEMIDKHPLIRGKTPNKTKSRDRVLSDDEMARIWRCTDDTTYGYILRLLILTGQRRMEVRNLKPEDVNGETITFHTKGDKINVLPLTPMVRENLKIPFTFNNWADSKRRFDDECGVEFRHHDLRRTLATKLAEKGVSVVTIERILGHAFGGVKAVYNRYSYLPEMRDALLLYEKHIRTIIIPS